MARATLHDNGQFGKTYTWTVVDTVAASILLALNLKAFFFFLLLFAKKAAVSAIVS